MISMAISLAFVTFFGWWIIYRKLPEKVRMLIQRFPLIADAGAALLTYGFLGGTLTALLAGGVVALLTSSALYVANNKDKFLYLDDVADAIKAAGSKLTETLNEFGEKYREQRACLA